MRQWHVKYVIFILTCLKCPLLVTCPLLAPLPYSEEYFNSSISFFYQTEASIMRTQFFIIILLIDYSETPKQKSQKARGFIVYFFFSLFK